MANEKFQAFAAILVALALINDCASADVADFGYQPRQVSQTQRPIAPGPNNSNVGAAVTTARPVATTGQAGGSVVVEIQTPPTTPSNVLSVIVVKPADGGQTTARPIQTTARPIQTTARPIQTTARPIQTTARPIQTTARPIQTTARPIQTTARPIQTTARPIQTTARPIQTTARPIQTTARPIQTTARPIQTTTASISATVSVGTTRFPGTTVNIPSCPLVNIMAVKTGLTPILSDPCSYVSCIRADVTLYCAIVRCDIGFAFSSASNRCIQSNLCNR